MAVTRHRLQVWSQGRTGGRRCQRRWAAQRAGMRVASGAFGRMPRSRSLYRQKTVLDKLKRSQYNESQFIELRSIIWDNTERQVASKTIRSRSWFLSFPQFASSTRSAGCVLSNPPYRSTLILTCVLVKELLEILGAQPGTERLLQKLSPKKCQAVQVRPLDPTELAKE